MTKEKIYHVRIRGPFTATQRTRAGIVVSVSDGYTGPLTGDQLKAIKADELLSLSEGAPDPDEANAAVADAQKQAETILNEASETAKQIVDAAHKQASDIVAKAKTSAPKN